MKRLACALLLLLNGGRAGAVGLDGPAAAERRFGVGMGIGIDQVGGHGRELYLFQETSAHAEIRLGGGLYLGSAFTSRADLMSYNHALDRSRGGTSALAIQGLIGYDGRLFHLSAGPWFYGSNRVRPGRFIAAVLPYGVLRLRVGSLDGWHAKLRLIDGAPYTAEGGPGLRLQLGLPPRGRHRLVGGVYTSLGEKVAGLVIVDEIEIRLTVPTRLKPSTLRFGATLGTDLGHPGRPEVMLFGGVTW